MIEKVKNWLEPKSVKDIQVFLCFANFYCCFIHNFSKIAGPLMSMLKRTSRIRWLGVVLLSVNVAEKNEFRDDSSNSIKSIITPNKSTRVDYLIFKGTISVRDFRYLTPDAKNAFNYLQHTFTKAFILHHFDLERYIWVKINVSSYAISGVLSQLTLDNLG